jgi:AIG2 family protein
VHVTVRYFAYGSNMETATFRGRRGIEVMSAVAARAAGWRLALDKPPLIPVGQAFANIVPHPGGTVLGVLYEISAQDLAHIDLTEGVLVDNYRRITVPVTSLASPEETVEAFTLVSHRRDPALRPSHRYMACLIAGAEEHGLPFDYIAWLRAVPADDETPEAQAARALMDEVLRKTREDRR